MKNVNETAVQATGENVRLKPYTLRKLSAEDVFPMLTIVKKIGLKEFSDLLNKETLENVVDLFLRDTEAEKSGDNENTMVAIGLSILPTAMDIVDVVLGNIVKIENDLYKFLEQISDLSVDEIKKLEMADFFEMIVDVVKKEEFKDFFSVVSKLFK